MSFHTTPDFHYTFSVYMLSFLTILIKCEGQAALTCEPNYCIVGTCVHGASTNGYPFHCICPSGYHGERCEHTEPCTVSSCQNGGTCNSKNYDGFDPLFDSCTCRTGFHGRHCELSVCSPKPCQHGGSCQVVSATTYQCACPSGYTGDQCEVAENGCLSKPCQNGGTCLRLADGTYRCACWLGYTGVNCTVDECEPSPCQNGGTCQILSNGATDCACPMGYTGRNCEIPDVCRPNPCQNGGLCTRHTRGTQPYTCHCQSEYIGANCEVKPICTPNPCLHGGVCTPQPPRNQAYTCYCQSGHTGTNCEVGPTIPFINSTTTVRVPVTSTTIATTVSSPTTPQYGTECDKLKVISDIVIGNTAFSLDSPSCPSGSYTSPEAFVIKNCNSLGNPSLWRRGSNVMESCMSNDTEPVYTPIGTFNGPQYNSNIGWAAIFLGCENYGFKLSIQMCDGEPMIVHVRQGNIGFHAEPSEYFWIVT